MKELFINYWVFIKKYKFIVIVILVLTTVVIGLFALRNQEPIVAPSPTPAPLVVRNISPQLPEFRSIWSTEPIIFTFNKALDLESIKVSISPNTQVNVKTNPSIPNQFSIVPIRGWDANRDYTITISNTLRARDGGSAGSELSFKLKRLFDPSDVEEIPDEHGDE